MKKKLLNTISNWWPALIVVLLILGLWELSTRLEWIQAFLLPSPESVALAFIQTFEELMKNTLTSLTEAFWGLGLGIAFGFVIAILMDRFLLINKAVYPFLIVSQTIPVIAIAPLLVLWLGSGIEPKVLLIAIVSFFPISIGLLNGFKASDSDLISLLRSMGATKRQILWHVKLPSSMDSFFAGLKISVSYSIVGAIIAEWIGGNSGLGVYLNRVYKSYSISKTFTVIFLVIILTLILIYLVSLIEKRAMRWKKQED